MGKQENLTRTFSKLEPEHAREIRSKGGKASAKARKIRNEMKKRLQLILSLPPKNVKELEKMGLDPTQDDLDNLTVIAVSLFNQAKKGNVRAIEQIAMGFDREEAMIKKLEAEAAKHKQESEILKKQLAELQQEKEVDKLDALLKGIGALAEDEINS